MKLFERAAMTTDLKETIDAAFERRQEIKPGQGGEVAEAVEAALALSIPVRRASRRSGMACGSSMIGSRKRCCSRSGLMTIASWGQPVVRL